MSKEKFYEVNILVTSDISEDLLDCGMRIEFILSEIQDNYIITGNINDTIKKEIGKIKEVKSITVLKKINTKKFSLSNLLSSIK